MHISSHSTSSRPALVLACLGLLVVLAASAFVSCGEVYQTNPVGYNYLLNQGATTPQALHISPTAAATVKAIPHLRSVGLGTTLASFSAKYGVPLASSQPPTLYVLQAGLDPFPDGSALVVSFDIGNDTTPRALQISYVAGNAHPTTYAQAQAIAESFFPDDASGPTLINKQDTSDKKICLSKGYMSDTLATVFPPQDFTGPNGSIAKPGTVAVSFFPHYQRIADGEDHSTGADLDDPNIVSSILVTLGTKPYC
jgi:hypothetical protein